MTGKKTEMFLVPLCLTNAEGERGINPNRAEGMNRLVTKENLVFVSLKIDCGSLKISAEMNIIDLHSLIKMGMSWWTEGLNFGVYQYYSRNDGVGCGKPNRRNGNAR